MHINLEFAEEEYYHVYNRGVEKRSIVVDEKDSARFIQSLIQFNSLKPIGSIFENTYEYKKIGSETSKELTKKNEALVEIIAYCLNPNHFHMILSPVVEDGISKFMHRLGTGYTKYFNKRHKRSGSLFQGLFKAKHLEDNDYLLHVSAYVNLNDRVHKIGSETSKVSKLVRKSYGEYEAGSGGFCQKDVILDQFKNRKEYTDFCEDSLELMHETKDEQNELKDLNLLEY
ncbi:MAG: transposase [Candidatus Paceibacterota bacterium]|jgi:REP element-mobilizing transposase RayT